jgi:hypothetical protein
MSIWFQDLGETVATLTNRAALRIFNSLVVRVPRVIER